MKVLAIVSCFLAVASAGYVGHYHGHHIPILDHNGYQLDTPEVAHAKAEHFAAHAEANARNGHGLYSHGIAPLAYAGHYHGHYLPAFDHNGYQLDTPEVAHAKAAHFAAHAEAASRSYAHGHPFVHYRKRRGILATPVVYAHGPAYAGHYGYHGPQHLPVIGPHGVPLDEPAVVAARAHHAVAHAEAHARNGDYHHGYGIAPLAYAGHYNGYHGYHHIPAIGPHGVPLDEPAVAHAKIAHAAAHAEARARNGDYYHY